ncbi:MAG: sigma-70 family RNA polymerase sigma factor [Gemmataceae bacterium]
MSSTSSFNTIHLHQFIQRWREGDNQAANQLCHSIARRMEELAQKMLRNFPNVRAWADTADIYQGAVVRLLKSLRQLQPASTRDFYNLAAVHVRRELLDLARRFRNRPRPGSGPRIEEDSDLAPPDSKVQSMDDIELWTRFHEAVERLIPLEREVFCLSFYHGWKQNQIAELIQCDIRTVRRHWASACINLTRIVGGTLPLV